MLARMRVASQVMSAKNCAGCGVRTRCCVRSEIFSRRPQLGLQRASFHRRGLPVHESTSGQLFSQQDGKRAGCFAQRVLCLAGSQYTSVAFGLRSKDAGERPSLGSVGDAYDNAMCESFFSTLESELLNRRSFRTKAEAKMAVFEFIEGWYNPGRRHSALGYMSPINYERSRLDTLESDSPYPSTEPGEVQL